MPNKAADYEAGNFTLVRSRLSPGPRRGIRLVRFLEMVFTDERKQGRLPACLRVVYPHLLQTLSDSKAENSSLQERGDCGLGSHLAGTSLVGFLLDVQWQPIRAVSEQYPARVSLLVEDRR